MAIHPSFPTSPYDVLSPEFRWFPADEALRESSYEKLLPPLVHKIRKSGKGERFFMNNKRKPNHREKP